jgi:hypothetical protein
MCSTRKEKTKEKNPQERCWISEVKTFVDAWSPSLVTRIVGPEKSRLWVLQQNARSGF